MIVKCVVAKRRKVTDSRFDPSQSKDVDRTEGQQLSFRCSEPLRLFTNTPVSSGGVDLSESASETAFATTTFTPTDETSTVKPSQYTTDT